MIPGKNNLLTTELQTEQQPSKTYRMMHSNLTITGNTDRLDAMRQAVFKMLNTERYKHSIYSWGFGTESENLFGEPVDYVCPELQRCITEALMQDDRIIAVSDFSFDVEGKQKVATAFTVNTIFGFLNTRTEVDV